MYYASLHEWGASDVCHSQVCWLLMSGQDFDDILHGSKFRCPIAGCEESFETEDACERHCIDQHSATTMDLDLIHQVQLGDVEEMAEVFPYEEPSFAPMYEDLSGAAGKRFEAVRDRSRDRVP